MFMELILFSQFITIFSMKYFYTITLLLLLYCSSFAQTAFYTQNFDGVASLGLLSNWSSTSTTTQLLNNIPSDYSGASGAQNLFMANCQPNNQNRSVTVAGINTVGKQELTISFGHRRTAAFNVPVTLEWSNDGSNWNQITYSTPTTTSAWSLFTSEMIPTVAENQTNLQVRWTWTTNNNDGCVTAVPNYRIDDFKVIAATTLPIALDKFSAKKHATSCLLSFTTATEKNNAYFAIERSNDGRAFTQIGAIKGAGTSLTQQDYTYTDEKPLRGTNFYRLKQVDFDGRFSYSPVVSVVFGKVGNVVLYPTPTTSTMNVRLEEAFQTEANWQVIDLIGRIITEGIFPAEQTDMQIPVGTLSEGNYVLRVTAGQEVITQKFRKIEQ
jgi:hypothetical protein